MSGWTVPPNKAVPPSPGVEPPPSVGMHHGSPGEEKENAETESDLRAERSQTHREWAEQDAEAAQHVSTADLRRDADHTRDQLNQDVVDLRQKFGLDRGGGDGRRRSSGPLASVRRHPVPVAIAAAGATTAALIGLKLLRDHRRTSGADRMKAAAKHGGKAAQRRLLDAKDTVVLATSELPRRGRLELRRLAEK